MQSLIRPLLKETVNSVKSLVSQPSKVLMKVIQNCINNNPYGTASRMVWPPSLSCMRLCSHSLTLSLTFTLTSVGYVADVATRLSPVCCERLVEVNAVGVIYRLILSCNRSLPHMEVIKFCVNILLNLAKVRHFTNIATRFLCVFTIIALIHCHVTANASRHMMFLLTRSSTKNLCMYVLTVGTKDIQKYIQINTGFPLSS